MMGKNASYSATYVMERSTVWMDQMNRVAKKLATKVCCYLAFFRIFFFLLVYIFVKSLVDQR